MVTLMMVFFSGTAFCQSQEAEQLLLDVQKLAQLKGILKDLKEGYGILSGGYSAIEKISAGSFSLHQQFLNGLLEVSPQVRKYPGITSILQAQLILLDEYRSAIGQFMGSGEFTAPEMSYITRVYSNILNQSTQQLGDLATLTTSGELRMSDDERLHAIDAIWKQARDQQNFIFHFTRQTQILALQRARERQDISNMNQLYFIKP